MIDYTKELTRALRRKEKTAAIQVLELAIQEGLPITLVWAEVFIPALTGLGRLWLSGRISEGQFERISRLACRVETEFRSRASQQELPQDTLFEEGIKVSDEEVRPSSDSNLLVAWKGREEERDRIAH